jgi:hypothetical protein
MVENLADVAVGKFKDGRIVGVGDIFFRHQKVIAEAVVPLPSGHAGLGARSLGHSLNASILLLLHLLLLLLALLLLALLLLTLELLLLPLLLLLNIGHFAAQDLVQGVEVLFFLPGVCLQELFKLGILGLVGVVVVLFDADFLVADLVLEQHPFLLG